MALESIISYEEYSNLDFEASEKVEAEIEKLCRDNIEELKRFCTDKLFLETDKISLIYYSLSECENYSFWNDFLTKEFARVFEIAINQNKMAQLYPLLENITVDETDSLDAEKVREILVKELDNKILEIRFNSLSLLEYWLDFDGIGIKQSVISKLREKTKDTNWKIRWNAHNMLKERNILVQDLSLMDKIRGRYGNIYSL
ncbi:hypothetical protein B0A67_18110 [Flavobacterium aquidurense]|uniref:hypothetical protein n=1 Tax=Flavobacterium aquidurense TaxID=362413 RepID=UPI0009189150|nr:hypothetical protein [Flavobacterium aquidurense]OXA69853.1 hypothetical protein B0A67_18110 [Flavobacterium aquidurense]SHG53359.1 hypothetical protein SAMN05444481_10546 [Flavobacterium frigidimaris]